jgi:hypothetical protein
VPGQLNIFSLRDNLYALYESIEFDCSVGIILDDPALKYVINLWCEDCFKNHPFVLIDKFESFEEISTFLRQDDEDITLK